MNSTFYKIFSRGLSKITRLITTFPIPTWGRPTCFKAFSKLFGVNQNEVEKPLTHYPNFDAFFTRDLKPDARKQDRSPGIFTSPVDGVVLESGNIQNHQLIQAKGVSYSLSTLCPFIDPRVYEQGAFTTIYLSPKDCHNIYAPLEGTLKMISHIPGKLYPVREPYISQFPNLYTKNERLNLHFDSPSGKFSVILIGAFNVGTMSTPFDDLKTNTYRTTASKRAFTVNVAQGDKIGTFHLGSTVILITEKKAQCTIKKMSPIQIGNALLRLL